MNQEFLERLFLDKPVHSLQYMLRRLSLDYDFLPELMTDGIFGERTLEAIMLFQRELYPPVTGVVDRGTWNAIRERWQEVEARHGPLRTLGALPSHESRVEPGMEREYLILPQTMFQVLARQFGGIRESPVSGVNDRDSAANIRWLQRAAGLEETGTLDRQSWDALSRLYEMFVVRELAREHDGFVGGWG